MFAQLVNLFKLRIGLLIAITALAGYAITPGNVLTGWEILLLGLCVFFSSASAGAFNQYVERDLDARMARTQNRPFVTGFFRHHKGWLFSIFALFAISVAAAAWLFNPLSAFYVFLGAFVYAVIYTVWLKRRSVWNIVIGGLAGSFAVLAGAAAADPGLNAASFILAGVLFLWTPSHFWSLAIALHRDYAAAGIPMLPVVVGDKAAARIILMNTFVMVVLSILPVFYGMGMIYLFSALTGGGWFLYRNIQLVRRPERKCAMANFFASMLQLAVLLAGAVLDVSL